MKQAGGSIPGKPHHAFLAGGGEMGERMRALDWSKTPLGAVNGWPQSLLGALGMMLPSKAQTIIFWGPQFVVFYNDACRPVFGAKHPNMLGQPGSVAWSEIWDTGVNLHRHLAHVVRTGEAFSASDLPLVIERDGFVEEAYFDVSYDPVRDASGRVDGVLCIVAETTGRVVGERRLGLLKDLTENSAAARTAREACALAMGTLARKPQDVRFALVYLNGGLEACTPGAEAALAAARPDQVRELQVTVSGAAAPCRLVVGLNTRRPFDGQYRAFLDLLAGQLSSALTNARVCEDERLRRQAQETLRESEERHRRLADLLPVAVYTCDAAGVITYYNRQAAELWGRAPRPGDTDERFCGSDQMLLANGQVLPHDQCPMAVALRDGASFRQQPIDIRRPDGSRISVMVNIDPVKDGTGRILGAINVFHDVTGLRRAEEALRDADRRKDEFLATLAHELRNPLAPIRNAVELLRDARVTDDVAEQARGILARQVDHMTRLVDDLLELSRITRGDITLRKEAVDLGGMVATAVEASRPGIDAAGHALHVSLPQQPVLLDADPLRIAQILTNVLNNAAKYTRRGGSIRLAAEREGSEVAISIRDNGIGIPGEMLPRIFDMFRQAGRNPAGEGLGVGLALARALAELHGGRMEARSDGPGRGSEFILRLPLPASSRAAGPPQAAGMPAPARRVLVVEDNVDAAESLGTLLRQMGHHVSIAYDGSAAVKAASERAPDVVLLDLGLPDIDGYVVAERLRADRRLASVPIIAVTARGGEADRLRSRATRFHDHLTKPVSPETLHALLSSPSLAAHRS